MGSWLEVELLQACGAVPPSSARTKKLECSTWVKSRGVKTPHTLPQGSAQDNFLQGAFSGSLPPPQVLVCSHSSKPGWHKGLFAPLSPASDSSLCLISRDRVLLTFASQSQAQYLTHLSYPTFTEPVSKRMNERMED